MKKFLLVTKSESCDDYAYFIEHPEMPTSEEITKFLMKNGHDVGDYYGDGIEIYEDVIFIEEITEFKTID